MAINGEDRISGDRPIVMVTNDDGIDAPGLRSLVRVLVSTNLYEVRVCAPDSYVLTLQFCTNVAISSSCLVYSRRDCTLGF